eukprot:PhF_6_TR19001/c0_g1_i2/m.27843
MTFFKTSKKALFLLIAAGAAFVFNDITLLQSGSNFQTHVFGLPFGHGSLPVFMWATCVVRHCPLFRMEIASVILMVGAISIAAGSDINQDTLIAEGFAMGNALCLCVMISCVKRNANQVSTVFHATAISALTIVLQFAVFLSLNVGGKWETSGAPHRGLFGWVAPKEASFALAIGTLQLVYIFAFIFSLKYLHTITVGVVYTMAAPVRHVIGSVLTPNYHFNVTYSGTFVLCLISIGMALYAAVEYRRTIEVAVSSKPWKKVERRSKRTVEYTSSRDDLTGVDDGTYDGGEEHSSYDDCRKGGHQHTSVIDSCHQHNVLFTTS